MAINPGYFQPGEIGNPAGRPKGSRNKRTQEILDLLSSRGDKDPLDFLSEIVSGNGQYPVELKVTAANYLLPYKHSKCGATPAPRYISEPVVLPHPRPQTLEQINEDISFLTDLKATGQIDIDIADFLIGGLRTMAQSIIAEEELKLKIAGSPLASKTKQSASREVSRHSPARTSLCLKSMEPTANIPRSTATPHRSLTISPRRPKAHRPRSNKMARSEAQQDAGWASPVGRYPSRPRPKAIQRSLKRPDVTRDLGREM